MECLDWVGIIIFGGNVKIEVFFFDDGILIEWIIGIFDLKMDVMSMEVVLKFVKVFFFEDFVKCVVIVIDGNENFGDVVVLVRSLIDDGVGIDCVLVSLEM